MYSRCIPLKIRLYITWKGVQNFLKTFINQYVNYNKIRWEVEKDAQLNHKERPKVLKVDVQNVLL
jgi:hypothetical protein